MSICKKKFLSLCLFFTIFFTSTFGFYFEKKAEAEVLTLSVTAVVALVVSAIASTGVIWYNRNDLYEIGQRVYNDISTNANIVSDIVKTTALIGGAKAISLTKDGVNYVNELISSFRTSTKTVPSFLYEVNKIYKYPSNFASLTFPDTGRNYANIELTLSNGEKFYDGTHYCTRYDISGRRVTYYQGEGSYTYEDILKGYYDSTVSVVSFRFCVSASRSQDGFNSPEDSVCVSPPSSYLHEYEDNSISASTDKIENMGIVCDVQDGEIVASGNIDNVIDKSYDDIVSGSVDDALSDTGTGVVDLDKVIDTSIPGEVEGELDTPVVNDLVDEIGDVWDNPFEDSLKSIEQMDTSQGVPPKIYFNLHDLFEASTSRFMDQNPFPDKETVLIDFEMINNYNFNGIPLIDFFRGIVGFGFIFTTLLYCLRKFSPDSVI